MFQTRYGLNNLIKDGSRVFSGVEEVTLKNIDACRTLAQITQTSLGPNSMNKMVINHLDKRFVTSDAAIMLNELEVQHPAAKLLIQATKMQQNEFGDATNFLLTFAGELLNQAEALIKMGIHTSEIIRGYSIAAEKCIEILESLACWNLSNPHDKTELQKAIKASVSSKQISKDAHIISLVTEAALIAMPNNSIKFDVDHIRVCQIIGGSIEQSYVINGMIILRDTEGFSKKKTDCKVMVLSCGLEMTGTEATSTVLLKSAQELLDFTKGEEAHMQKLIKSVKDAGVDVIIVNGSISDSAQHFCNKYDILTLKVSSKFEIKRLCTSLGATPLIRLGAPLADELGEAELIEVKEISSKRVTVVHAKETHVATIVLRGATRNILDELERSIDDAISCIKASVKSGAFVAGATATEIELANQLQTFGSTISGLDQYAVLKFATSLEIIPKILAENAGYNPTDLLTKLFAAHEQGQTTVGIDPMGPDMLMDALANDILDHQETKKWAIKLAVETTLNILRVDQILMSKPAGGPNPREPGPPDLD